ncbi:hypothetical protein BVRB_007970 [Beta vulgaris subsp. vulgaris]|uniref:Uncharacterized protein n=1 Tax=Beta vulgaris subsp. vulgaris TaxID=3555 RepID=A0A0J8DX72_BETVV|nr:hypothetical protein BVRB_007970 [Beta vulgaris subsp. vulgaris]
MPHLANDPEGENPPSNDDIVTIKEQGEGTRSARNQFDPTTLCVNTLGMRSWIHK